MNSDPLGEWTRQLFGGGRLPHLDYATLQCCLLPAFSIRQKNGARTRYAAELGGTPARWLTRVAIDAWDNFDATVSEETLWPSIDNIEADAGQTYSMLIMFDGHFDGTLIVDNYENRNVIYIRRL